MVDSEFRQLLKLELGTIRFVSVEKPSASDFGQTFAASAPRLSMPRWLQSEVYSVLNTALPASMKGRSRDRTER